MKIIGPARSEWVKETVRYQFRYSTLGLFAGLSCMFGGVFLWLYGVTGTTKGWSASWLGFHSSASDLPAGAMMIIAGLLVIFITRFVVNREQAFHEQKAKSKS